ncbi:EamA-like transporter family protein [Roseovarius nanhaiticus]|uniref:EamA-like transporter family protein n=2 Tax=Roseovarius nanhaiticus TaxID=573024 RepID=A0A1N7HKM0_9RHOB|nr:EamA-like transporter family protein [Roseovarius nanhaiticus]SIS25321.1 EamA-like transporter family protein [Roseovarius nanhaiticus]
MVLCAALMHATWNALMKGAPDRAVMSGLLCIGNAVFGAGLLILAPVMAPEAVPWAIASIIIHWGYFYMLNVAYRLGDLSLIYPISRGLAPLLVALGAQVWIGETLPLYGWLGVGAISVGISVLAAPALRGALPVAGVMAAVCVGVIVASYSLVDGLGVRASGAPLAYIGWVFVGNVTVALYVLPSRWGRLRALPARAIWIGLLGGIISGAAYGLVLYAKTLAPLGLVSALRETSVIFAAMIGVLWFGERPRARRVIAAVIVALGIVLIAGQG